MKRVPAAALAAVALVAVALSSASAREVAPPGSFVRYRATSVAELARQVRNDPTVRARYARHFGVPQSQVAKYFEGLRLTSLKRPAKVSMWYVGKGGRVTHTPKLLPKGTPVFVTSGGDLLLSWSCGNPLRAGLPRKVVKVKTQGDGAGAEAPAAKKTVTKPVEKEAPIAETPPKPEVPDTEVAGMVETAALPLVTAPPTPAVVAVAPVTSPPMIAGAAVPSVAVPPVIAAGSHFSPLWLLGGLAALGGGGGDNPKPPPVVPEPSSLVTIAVAMAGPMLFKLRRR